MTKKKKISLFLHIIALIFIVIFLSSGNLNFFKEGNPKNNRNSLSVSDHDDIFGEIYVFRPSKSEFLRIGQNFTIKWDSKGCIEFVTIALYKGYQYLEMITITTNNDGEYMWLIGNYEHANDYSIGIWDYMDFNNIDFSDYFTISVHAQGNFDNLYIYILIGFLIVLVPFGISFIILRLKKKK